MLSNCSMAIGGPGQAVVHTIIILVKAQLVNSDHHPWMIQSKLCTGMHLLGTVIIRGQISTQIEVKQCSLSSFLS